MKTIYKIIIGLALAAGIAIAQKPIESLSGPDAATMREAIIGNGTLTLNKLAQGGASANQTLTWNGSVWAPATPAAVGNATVDNASVNAAIATDYKATQNAILADPRQGRRMFGIFKKLQNSGFNAPQIRVAVIGDSYSNQWAEPYFHGKFGVGGRIASFRDADVNFLVAASGAAATPSNDYTKWSGARWYTLPGNGTLKFQNATNLSPWIAGYPVSHAEVYYFSENGTGTFKLQYETANSGTWADVANQYSGNTTLDSATVTLTSGADHTPMLKPGMPVSGTGIPANAVISSVGNTTFTMNATSNSTSSATYTIGATFVTNNGGNRTISKGYVPIQRTNGNNSIAKYSLRAIGTSGTSGIIGLGAVIDNSVDGSRPKGAVRMDFGIGGTTLTDLLAMPEADFNAAIQGFNPDIVFFRDWPNTTPSTERPNYATNFPLVMARLRTALPDAVIVVIPNHPDEEFPDPNTETPYDKIVREFCMSSELDIEYLDVRNSFPSSDKMKALNWMIAGDSHLYAGGNQWLDSLIRDNLPFLYGAPAGTKWAPLSGETIRASVLHGTAGVMGDGKFRITGHTPNDFAWLSLSPSASGNSFPSFSTGIAYMRRDATYATAENDLGFYGDGELGMQLGQGRVWIGRGGTNEWGISKQINAALVAQSPSSGVATAMLGTQAAHTSDFLRLNGNVSVSSDGDTLARFTSTGTLQFDTANAGITFKNSANGRTGNLTLSAGNATVSNTSILGNSTVLLSCTGAGNSTELGVRQLITRNAGGNFTVQSLLGNGSVATGDFSQFEYVIFGKN